MARAHTPGLSTADFELGSGGRVQARFTFAAAEPGLPTTADDMRAFLLDGVEVTADGARCTPEFRDGGTTEIDGLAMEASYTCASTADETRELAVTLYYLSALGPRHREVARISAAGATTEAVLTGESRVLALELPARGRHDARPRRPRRPELLVGVTAVFAAGWLALFVWRWRATRKR